MAFAATVIAIAAAHLTSLLACSCSDRPVTLTTAHYFRQPRALEVTYPSHPTKVLVFVGSSGRVLKVTLFESSGDSVLDRAGLRMAQSSNYLPAYKHCRRVKAKYLYVEDWKNDAS